MEFQSSEKRMEFAIANGFHFSKDEIEVITAELNEEDLNIVAGGNFCTNNNTNIVIM